MHILAIETTGAFASVTLAKAEYDDTRANGFELENFEILSKVQGHDRFSHLQNLTPQIEKVLVEGFAIECEGGDAKVSSSISDVDLIAVSQGPGSFTGIRIGVSTGRALSQVTGIPCVAVPTLEALAMRRSEVEDIFESDTLVCPILDARRSQVYGGGYMLKDGFPTEVIPAGAYTIDEFMELIDEAARGELSSATVSGGESTSNEAGSARMAIPKFNCVKFLGDGVDAYAEKINEIIAKYASGGKDGLHKLCFLFASEDARYQDSESVAKLAAKMHFEGKNVSFEDLKPEYMRLAEAERKLKEKQQSKGK